VGFSTLPREGEEGEEEEEGGGEREKISAALSIEGHFVAPMKVGGGKKAVRAGATPAVTMEANPQVPPLQEAPTTDAEERGREELDEEEEDDSEVLIEASMLQSSRRKGTTIHPSLLPQNYPRPKDLAPSLAKPFPTGLGTQFLDLSK